MCNHYKNINKILRFGVGGGSFIPSEVLEIECALYPQGTSQSRLAMFKVLESHVWLVLVTVRDSATRDRERLTCQHSFWKGKETNSY